MLFTPPRPFKKTIYGIYHTNYLPKKLDAFIFLLLCHQVFYHLYYQT